MSARHPDNRESRTSLKTINFSYLNANKSAEAIRELTLSRPRDSLYLISEVALTDQVPISIPGFYSIYDNSPDTRIRTCAYLKESAADCLDSFTTSPDIVSINFQDNWTVTACYIDPTSDIPDSLLTPLNDRQAIIGDFNAKHQQWFPTKPSDNSQYIRRGKRLVRWSHSCQTVERGPRQATRHQEGHQPSKLDLLWTSRHSTNFMCHGYFPNTRSDHQIVAARFRMIRPPKSVSQPRPNYKKMDPPAMTSYFASHSPPTSPSLLNAYLQEALTLVPTKTQHSQHRLPEELLSMRRSLRHAMKTRWGSDQYRTLRYQYRDALANHINSRIEETLDAAHGPEMYQFSKRGTPSKPVPTLQFNNRTYSGHEQIAKCLAEYHGARPRIYLPPINNPDIPPVTPLEVTDHLNKAPPLSSNGPDQVSSSLLLILHKTHPHCLSDIYTQVLRSGRHPRSWKTATIIPIPKANKPTYTVPKSWRSIHLLNVVSKTLERIVLSRLQTPSPLTTPDPLGPSQFGSRINRGTSDAMQAYTRWMEAAHSRNQYITLVATDIEGGFDQVHPSKLSLTDIDPQYIPWIQHWASDREIRFRHNNRLDLHTYFTNRGIPQGSPLSPFLFGAYIKNTVRPRISSDPHSSTLVISYVDDVLICVSATCPRKVQEITRAIWSELSRDALDIGMSFAENKTKTWHDRPENWAIGSTSTKLRFLGYWIETPPPSDRTGPPRFTHHINHWTTKANFMLNTIRALSLRSSRGLRTSAILQIFDACCKSMLHYGLEFWGHIPELTQKTDSFVYTAMKTLFDLPSATPHRAISSEFKMIPSHIRYHLIIRRIAARHLEHRPLQFMDLFFPPGQLSSRIASSISADYRTLPPPPTRPGTNWPGNLMPIDFSQKLDFLLLKDDDLFVFSDGSFKDDIASYGFVIFSGYSWKEKFSLIENHGRLTPRKSILDAEIQAMVLGLETALELDHSSDIYLLSDSQSALRLFLPQQTADTLVFTPTALALVSSTPPSRLVRPTWVRGHNDNPGNVRADTLARTATNIIDNFPGPSYSHLHLTIRSQVTSEWLEWFQKSSHYYKRKPTHSRRHHRNLTRLDTIVLFKLRSNKGWHPTDPIGTQIAPPCSCDKNSPRDGSHILTCPIYARHRPPDIAQWIYLDTRTLSVIKWARHHRHFGMVTKTSRVKWINLIHPGNIVPPSSTRQCTICLKTLSSSQNLNHHMKNIHPDGSTTSRAWDPLNRCPNCTLSFPTKPKLDDHFASTHGCPECDYHCATGGTLVSHLVTAHGGLPCTGCSLRFSGRLVLRQHQRSNCGGSRS